MQNDFSGQHFCPASHVQWTRGCVSQMPWTKNWTLSQSSSEGFWVVNTKTLRYDRTFSARDREYYKSLFRQINYMTYIGWNALVLCIAVLNCMLLLTKVNINSKSHICNKIFSCFTQIFPSYGLCHKICLLLLFLHVMILKSSISK